MYLEITILLLAGTFIGLLILTAFLEKQRIQEFIPALPVRTR